MSETRSSWPGQGAAAPTVDAPQSVDELAAAGRLTIQRWKARKRVPLDLPSGEKVVVEPPSLVTFVRAGRMPMELAQLVASKDGRSYIDFIGVMKVEVAEDAERFAQRLAAGVLVSPVAVAPDDGGHMRALTEDEIDVRDISYGDVLTIAAWALAYDPAKEENVIMPESEVTRTDAASFRDDERLPASVPLVSDVRVESSGAATDQ